MLQLAEKWGDKYAIAVRSWETHWEELATMFDYTPEILRLIYTTNIIEAYNRQLRKVTKNRGCCHWRSYLQAALAGSSGHRQEMDDACAQLGQHPEPVSDPL